VEGASGDAKNFVRLSHDPRTYFSNSPYGTSTGMHISTRPAARIMTVSTPLMLCKVQMPQVPMQTPIVTKVKLF
jgi:hypothetical protein